jgi:glutamate-ammonia-ligase adenylyltransferase
LVVSVRRQTVADTLPASLAQRINRAPRVKSATAAKKRVQSDLFAEAPAKTRQALAKLVEKFPKIEALAEGLAEGSPYLWDAVTSQPARWLALLQCNPDDHLATLLAKTSNAAASWADDEAAMRDLRLMKAEASLLIAVADIGGVWELETVTRALTQVADTAVDAAVRYLYR